MPSPLNTLHESLPLANAEAVTEYGAHPMTPGMANLFFSSYHDQVVACCGHWQPKRAVPRSQRCHSHLDGASACTRLIVFVMIVHELLVTDWKPVGMFATFRKHPAQC